MTQRRSSPPISPHERSRLDRSPDARRRVRAGRDLRADGGRDRPRLRGPAPRQLCLRTADHGGRLHAPVHLRLAPRGPPPLPLPPRRGSVARAGAGRLPPPPPPLSRGEGPVPPLHTPSLF